MTCVHCNTMYLADPPDDLTPYYPPTYYHPCDSADQSEIPKVAILQQYCRPGHVIEIGPGTGGFLRSLRTRGYEVSAIEMDSATCARLTAEGITTHQSDRPDTALEQMAPAQSICLWQVLEHLRYPRETLQAAALALKPGGILIVATPNPNAFQFKLLGPRWTHLDAPRHLYLLSPQWLCKVASSAGLDLVMLTASDRTANDWNTFAWAELLCGSAPGIVRRWLSYKLGALIAMLLAPIERRALRGSSYTAVFSKPS